MDRTETVGYEDRDGMARDVERRSDEGWIVRRITSLPGDACEVEYERSGGGDADRSGRSPVPYLEGGPLAPPHPDAGAG